ncbi:L,D-transpeptidase family protein [Labilibaculum sp.]|uniref:L,D-transpeptidase family protein n=1 Tax=Labilibaculum sp. TaxID=2060723 RepID=UPI0035677D5A
MRKRKFQFLIGSIAFLAISIAVFSFIYLQPLAPHLELRRARFALNTAQKSGADKYASSLYIDAKQFYDSAMNSWMIQNEKFFLQRDYKQVLEFVQQSINKASEAEQKALSQIESSNKIARQAIEELETKVMLYNRVYKPMPLSPELCKTHKLGAIKLAEAKIAYQSGKYIECFASCSEASKLVNESNLKAENSLVSWFADYSKWKELGNRAISLSKQGRKIILVDKMAHQCIVYQNGKQLRGFTVELGVNWMGDKRHKGDKATPEGIYQVIQKKNSLQTKFHKALLLNYPNHEDKERFSEDQKKGLLSFQTHIGNLIEIHGCGGKGIDWTDGCVALKNDDMDVLYRIVDDGASVIIVGSLKSLEEIYENKE